jgi:signal transduction histidine kinase
VATILKQKEEWVIILKSIRKRMLLAFSLIELLLLILVFALNFFFADDFYIKNNTAILKKSIQESISNYFPTNIPEISNFVSLRSGANVQIVFKNKPQDGLGPQGGTAPFNGNGQKELVDRNIIHLINQADLLDGTTFIEVTKGDGENNQTRFIVSSTKLDDNTYLFTTAGLGIIDGTFKIFTTFLFESLFISYLLGFIAIWFYATTFTNPLRKLSKRTDKVSHLEFEGSPLVATRRGDEIDQLIVSVNKMELELSKFIEDLQFSNHKLEQELAKEKDIDQLRTRFLSDVSHELKNPLSIILGYSEALDRGIIKEDEDKKYYIEVIHNECLRMNRLVKDLLNLSRIQAPGFEVELEDCDLVSLIQEIFYNYKKAFNLKHTNIEWKIPESLIVQIDPNRFTQILTNLLDNALKHVDDKGIVGISLQPGATDNSYTLEISNTGDLIQEEEQSRIWEGFYQIDTDTNGSGLGLTIVKQLVELHNAEISLWVDDRNRFRIIKK